MWGIIPAAGSGTRIQPLAFSKELLPVGCQQDGFTERPRAVSEYLVDRMRLAGVTRLCFVISPAKTDIVHYYSENVDGISICYTVQAEPKGLCDAIFRAVPFINEDEPVLVGLPDTVWFPETGFCALSGEGLSFLLFPVEQPQHFDAVKTDPAGRVQEIQVKHASPETSWVWGAFRLSGRMLHRLYHLWLERERRDEYFGHLVNAYLAAGGSDVWGVRAGESYFDVGTLAGYRNAIRILSPHVPPPIDLAS